MALDYLPKVNPLALAFGLLAASVILSRILGIFL